MSCVFVYVFCVDTLGFVDIRMYVGGGFYLFISLSKLSIYLYTYGWYAMNCGSVCVCLCAISVCFAGGEGLGSISGVHWRL